MVDLKDKNLHLNTFASIDINWSEEAEDFDFIVTVCTVMHCDCKDTIM